MITVSDNSQKQFCLMDDSQLEHIEGAGFWRSFGEYAAIGGGAIIGTALAGGNPAGGFLGGAMAMAAYNGILGPETK